MKLILTKTCGECGTSVAIYAEDVFAGIEIVCPVCWAEGQEVELGVLR